MKKDFDDRLARADVGDEIVYHIGFHCMDPEKLTRNEMAKRAWQAYERGDVLLYQRRIGKDELHYIAKVVK